VIESPGSLTLMQRSVRLRNGRPSDSADALTESQSAAVGTSTDTPTTQGASTSWSDATRDFLIKGEEAWSKHASTWWHRDVFHSLRKSLKAGEYLHAAAPAEEWLLLFGAVATFFSIDNFVIRRLPNTLKVNALSVVFWLFTGGCYNIYFALRYGRREGVDWCLGYLLEWILSMDNMFVFLVVFKAYDTPEILMRKALFIGILGGVILKVFIFMALGTLLHVIHWFRIVFGVLLVYSGITAVTDDESEDIESRYVIRAVRFIFGSRLQRGYTAEGTLFPVDSDGRHCVSLLLLVIICLEFTDAVFAVDSVSAKVAQIPNQYVAYSSSVVAMFALRSMFFVIKDLIDYFELLKYGMCIILVFIGVELMASPFLHLETATVCIVIVAVFVVSIAASTAKKVFQDKVSLDCGVSPFSSHSGWDGPRGAGAHEAG